MVRAEIILSNWALFIVLIPIVAILIGGIFLAIKVEKISKLKATADQNGLSDSAQFLKNTWSAHIRNLLIGLILAWITFTWTTRNDYQKDILKKVETIQNEKVDRVELIRHEDYDNKRFDEIKTDYQKSLDEIKLEFRDMKKDVIDILKKK